MFLFAAIVILTATVLSYDWFGWMGPVVVLAAGALIVWQISEGSAEQKHRAAALAESERQRTHNADGHRRPGDSRGYKGRYKSPYSNWRTVAARENNVCHICGRIVDPDDFSRSDSGAFRAGPLYPTVDHVVPRSAGGTHHWTNLKLAHLECNSSKGKREFKEFMEEFDG